MALESEIRAHLESALESASSWFEVYSALKVSVPDGEEDRYRALVWAFGYDLFSRDDTDRFAREGCVFGAMWELEGGRLPPRVSDVPPPDVEMWLDAFDEVDDPKLQSRVGDLLWCRKTTGAGDKHARAACRALLALSETDGWEPMEATEGLVRALHLTRELSDSVLGAEVVERTTAVIKRELLRDDRPGISLSLLRSLVDLPESEQPTGLADLVQQAASVYGSDPHLRESVYELEVALAVGPEGRRRLRSDQAELWRTTARSADGFLRASFLEKALDVARTHGLAELARELRVELQSVTEEELDLKVVSSEIRVDRTIIDAFHDQFVRFDTWQASLTAFGGYGPPGGEPQEVEADVTRQMRDFPLQFLVSKVVLDPDLGVPIFHAIDEESHRIAAIAQSRWFSSQLWATSAVEILQRIEVRFGRPRIEDQAEFFTSAFVDAGTADRIARAFHLWWDDRADESSHLIVPRIEATVRNLAREAGLPIIREPLVGKPGGVRPLGELLHRLSGGFVTPGWHTYFLHLLVDPLGLNLRNVIAHGIRGRIERLDAALLLHAAAFLRLLDVQRPESTPS